MVDVIFDTAEHLALLGHKVLFAFLFGLQDFLFKLELPDIDGLTIVAAVRIAGH